MNSALEAPVKAAKKKKRSFLDDDDFFIMKKPKSKPSPGPKPELNQLAQSNLVQPRISPKKETVGGADLLSSDDLPHAYHSANESFAHSDVLESPTTHIFTPRSSDLVNNESVPQDRALASTGSETRALSIPGGSFPASFSDKTDGLATTVNGIDSRAGQTPSVPVVSGLEADLSDDDFDPDLQEFFSGLAKTKSNSDGEHDRLYLVKVCCRLGFPYEFTKEITGDTTFAELFQELLKDTIKLNGVKNYWNMGVLVWIDGRSELKPIFKPSSLRIPRPSRDQPTKINCLYIPREHLSNFETLYPEFHRKLEEDEVQELMNLKPADVVEVDDKCVEQAHGSSNTHKQTQQEPEKSQYFVIGIKGKDNKRIEAEVGPTTKIRSLLKYYMQVKGIEEEAGQKPRVIFDDEDLDLDSVVGDTELEEDFEVQVYI